MAASGHDVASPSMRTFAHWKARFRSLRERRDIMSATQTLYHTSRKNLVLFIFFILLILTP